MITNLHIYYYGKDFFGHWDSMLECHCNYPSEKDFQKALLQFKKDRSCAFGFMIDDRLGVNLSYDNYNDFDTGLVTIRESISRNEIEVRKVSYEYAKKYVMQKYKAEKAETEVA